MAKATLKKAKRVATAMGEKPSRPDSRPPAEAKMRQEVQEMVLNHEAGLYLPLSRRKNV